MKYRINSEEQLIELKEDPDFSFEVGDIIVHKPFEFYTIQGLIKKHFGGVDLFPASPGTPVYSINGYGTSVVSRAAPEVVVRP